MQLKLHAFDLPLRHVFTISRGSMTVQPTLVVELIEDGHHGFGESTTNDYYGFTLKSMAEALQRVQPQLETATAEDPVELWDQLAPILADNPFAQCALDQAAHDLWGKRQGQPVYQLWGLDLQNIPVSNYTIGIDDLDVMVAKMAEVPRLAGVQDQAGHAE